MTHSKNILSFLHLNNSFDLKILVLNPPKILTYLARAFGTRGSNWQGSSSKLYLTLVTLWFQSVEIVELAFMFAGSLQSSAAGSVASVSVRGRELGAARG